MSDRFDETMAAGKFVLKVNPSGVWRLYVTETISGHEETVRMSTTSETCAGAWRSIGDRMERHLAEADT